MHGFMSSLSGLTLPPMSGAVLLKCRKQPGKEKPVTPREPEGLPETAEKEEKNSGRLPENPEHDESSR